MYECMIVCMCVPEFMGRLNQGPNPQGNLQICYAGVCARNCALANPKVHQNPSCHTSKLPQQQRGVCQKLRFSKPQSAPKPILPHQQTPTAAAGCEQNHSCLRAEGISWPGLESSNSDLGRTCVGLRSTLPRPRSRFQFQGTTTYICMYVLAEMTMTMIAPKMNKKMCILGRMGGVWGWRKRCFPGDSMVHGKLGMRNPLCEFLISSFPWTMLSHLMGQLQLLCKEATNSLDLSMYYSERRPSQMIQAF